MWTCPKCGEVIEDQFKSCWKCAGDELPAILPRRRVKTWEYVTAAVMAYLIPCCAVYIQSSSSWWRISILLNGATWRLALALLAPAAINFFVLIRFLRSRIASWAVAVVLLVAWTGVMVYMNPKYH